MSNISYAKDNRETIANAREIKLDEIRKKLFDEQTAKLEEVKKKIDKEEKKLYPLDAIENLSFDLSKIGVVLLISGTVVLAIAASSHTTALGSVAFSLLGTGAMAGIMGLTVGAFSTFKGKDLLNLREMERKINKEMQHAKEDEIANTSQQRDWTRNYIRRLKIEVEALKNGAYPSTFMCENHEGTIRSFQKALLSSSQSRRILASQLRKGLAERLKKQKQNN